MAHVLEPVLARIADALERLAPPRAAEPGRMIRAPKYRATLVDPYRDHLRARRAESR